MLLDVREHFAVAEAPVDVEPCKDGLDGESLLLKELLREPTRFVANLREEFPIEHVEHRVELVNREGQRRTSRGPLLLPNLTKQFLPEFLAGTF
jgi:hypothetical protein